MEVSIAVHGSRNTHELKLDMRESNVNYRPYSEWSNSPPRLMMLLSNVSDMKKLRNLLTRAIKEHEQHPTREATIRQGERPTTTTEGPRRSAVLSNQVIRGTRVVGTPFGPSDDWYRTRYEAYFDPSAGARGHREPGNGTGGSGHNTQPSSEASVQASDRVQERRELERYEDLRRALEETVNRIANPITAVNSHEE